MSSLSPAEVARIAALARIDLSEDELARLSEQLDAIVDAVAVVTEAVDESIPATTHPLPLANVHRPDVVQPSLTQAEALAAAPAAEAGRFRVPQILGEEA